MTLHAYITLSKYPLTNGWLHMVIEAMQIRPSPWCSISGYSPQKTLWYWSVICKVCFIQKILHNIYSYNCFSKDPIRFSTWKIRAKVVAVPPNNTDGLWFGRSSLDTGLLPNASQLTIYFPPALLDQAGDNNKLATVIYEDNSLFKARSGRQPVGPVTSIKLGNAKSEISAQDLEQPLVFWYTNYPYFTVCFQ